MEIISQKELERLYNLQRKGKWQTVQKNQMRLKEKLLQDFKDGWFNYKKQHPNIGPVFDLKNRNSQEFIIDEKVANEFKLKEHLNDFLIKSQNSTAGIRAFVDIYNSQNPQKMYNDLFLAVLVQAEAEFLKQIHKETQKKLENVNIDELCQSLRKNIPEKNIEIIEDIYRLKLENVIELIRKVPIRLVGGEVRPHTGSFIEMETRILVQNGIKVITLEKYSDTTAIYIFSYLCFLLGATGATYYTSSHSSNYVCGRKVLASDGSQILPDVYENYRIILNRIVNDDIYKSREGYKIKISKSNHPNILNNLSYKKIAKLYSSMLNTTKEDVEIINKAASRGHKIIINALNGSLGKTLKPIFSELEINQGVFEWLYEEEDSLFNTGFIVVKSKDKKTGRNLYGVEHLGVDTTIPDIVNTISYPKLLKGKPLGTKIYECDPDSDRFVIKQIMNKKDISLLDKYGIQYYELDNDKILAAPSPNKVFLCLDIVDYELMKNRGIWDNYSSLYLITYVSWRAWSEFADSVKGFKKMVTLVGFKNLTALKKKVEKWYFNTDKPELVLTDSLGNKVEINRTKRVRIHCAEEESGGRVAGMNKVCHNLLGEKVMIMPEKSAADSLISELIYSSKLHLENSSDYIITNFLDNRFKKYNLVSKIDFRLDILHGIPQGVIAQMDYKKQQVEMKKASAIKTNFNNFFFSLAKAVDNEQIVKQKVKEILTEIMPTHKDTWCCLDKIILTEELLAKGKKRPEGVIMTFEQKNDFIPIVSELDFRPSGTDPLKSKVYGDAFAILPAQLGQIKKDFEELAQRDLYEILEKYNIKSVIKKE
ncbi:hypothetical protein KAT63_03760 [Candidatus Parcubacteria bacterium]|nr:hypothetical protein [Candidatus Parcubacteria bacterium]